MLILSPNMSRSKQAGGILSKTAQRYYMADLASIGLRADFREIQQADKALDNFAASGVQAGAAATSFNKAAGQTTAVSGQMRGALQGLGYQVQDAAVQLQAGTSALTVFVQQGSQVASMFGPTGAVVGALLAVGGAVAAGLLPSLMSSKSAMEQLEEATEELGKTFERSESGTLSYTQAIKDLAEQSEKLAKIELAQSMLNIEKATELAGKAIKENLADNLNQGLGRVTELVSFLDDFGVSATQLANGGVAELELKLSSFSGTLSEYSEMQNKLGVTTDRLKNVTASLGAQFGLNEGQAVRFIDAVGRFNLAPTAENIKTLQVTMEELNDENSYANKSFVELTSSMVKAFSSVSDNVDKANLLKLALAGNTEEIKNLGAGATKAESAIKAYSQALQIARAEAEGNTEKAYLLRAAFAAGYETIKEIPAPLRDIATELAGIEINEKFIKQMEQVEQMLQDQFDAMEELDAIDQRRFDRREQALQDQFDAEAELVEIYDKQNKRLSETVTLSEKAAERIEEALSDAWLNAFDGFESMADGIKNAFKRMLAEMAHMALTRPIMVSMGLGGLLPSGANAATGIAGLSGLSDFFSSTMGMATVAIGALAGINKLTGGGLFGTSYKVSGQDLSLGLGGGDVTGSVTTEESRKRSLFRGTKRRASTSAFDTTELDLAFDEIQSALAKAAEQIGVIGASEVLNNFTASFSMSVKDKSQAEIDKAIQDWISGTTSSMVEAVFGDMLGGLQQSGETLLQTLDRVSTNMATVSTVTESLGLKYGLTGKAAAEAATRIVDLTGGLQSLTALTSQYYQSFYTEAERQLMLQQQLATAFGELNMVTPSSREAFRAIVDGIDLTTEAGQKLFAELMKLVPGLDQYLSAIEAQKNAIEAQKKAAEEMQKALDENRLNLQIRLLEAQGNATDALALRRQMELAATDESLRAMLLAIYAAEDAARAQNELATAQERAAKAAEQAAAAAESVARDAFGKLQDAAQREIKAADDVLKSKLDAINAERAALNDSNKLLIDGYNDQIKAVEQYASKLEGLNGVINDFLGGGASGGTDPFSRLTQILSEARAGLTPDQGELSSVFGAIRSNGSAGFTSAEDQAFAMARALNQAQQLGGIVSGRLGGARSQVQLIEQQIKDATEYYEKQLEKLDKAEALAQEQHDEAVALVEQQLQLAQSQLDALLGIDNRMLTLNQAMLEFGAALNDLRNAQQTKPAQADPAMLELLKELVAGNESIAKHTKTSADALEFDKYRAAEANA